MTRFPLTEEGALYRHIFEEIDDKELFKKSLFSFYVYGISTFVGRANAVEKQ